MKMGVAGVVPEPEGEMPEGAGPVGTTPEVAGGLGITGTEGVTLLEGIRTEPPLGTGLTELGTEMTGAVLELQRWLVYMFEWIVHLYPKK